jgi:hypothetical protein
VIVQTFATLNGGQGVLGETLTDAAGTALAGAQHLGSTVYGFDPTFPLFGGVEAQATIAEYWIPNFAGDFDVKLNEIVDSSFQGMRVDAIVVAPPAGSGVAAPFALTSVPEPATLAGLGVGALLLLGRRKR